jgi:flagellar protein FlaF
MENAIVSLFCIVLFLVGALTMGMTSFSLADKISTSLSETEDRRYEMRQTGITTVNATASGGSQVTLKISNDGAVSLADFERWDVIIRYQDGTAMWLPYNGYPGWQVNQISFGDDPEVFEPGILNAGEDMQLTLALDPPISENTTGEVTVSTPKGVIAKAMVKQEASK